MAKAVRSASGLRVLAPPRLAESSGAMTLKTRLRLSERDTEVLHALGAFLSGLAVRDLAERVFLGTGHTREDFARRKREITALSSARWAGTLTRGSNDQWELARRAQAAHLASLTAAVEAIEARLAVPVAACDIATRTTGYPSQKVRAAKQQRRQVLLARLARTSAEQQAGHVRVVRGGADLLHTRLHLSQAGPTVEDWQQAWRQVRTRIEADGESGKPFGNETIRITPEGTVRIKLPGELAARFTRDCDPHGRYTLDAAAQFAHRDTEWRAQIGANRTVGYTIRFEGDRRQRERCYLTAAFTPIRPALAEGVDDPQLMQAALAGGVIGIDHNADHLAAWRLDTHGNPIGRPERIDVDYTGSTHRRDAQVRHACSQVIHHAKESGATALVIEDLGFDTGRDECGGPGRGGKRFRKTVAGMPVAKFAARLIAMAHRAHLAVIVIDPAYSSRWGAQHWCRSTSTTTQKTSRHDAAAIVIGRRGQGLGARRRTEKTVPRKKTEAAQVRPRATTRGRAGTEAHPLPARIHQPRLHRAPRTRARPEDRAHDAPRQRTRTTAQPAQDRSERATDVQTWTQDALPLGV